MATKTARRTSVTPEMFVEMRRLRAKGYLPSQIAARVGPSAGAVSRYAPASDVDLSLEAALVLLRERLRADSLAKSRDGKPTPNPANGSWASRDDSLETVMRAIAHVPQTGPLGPNTLTGTTVAIIVPDGPLPESFRYPILAALRRRGAVAAAYCQAAQLLEDVDPEGRDYLLAKAEAADTLTEVETEYLRYGKEQAR